MGASRKRLVKPLKPKKTGVTSIKVERLVTRRNIISHKPKKRRIVGEYGKKADLK